MIVLYSSEIGGVGKTTLAINHAYFKKCPIIDLGLQNSSMFFNKIRKKKNKKRNICYIDKTIKKFNKIIKEYKSNKNNMIIIDSGIYDRGINTLALTSADIIITPVGLSSIELSPIELVELQQFRNILNDASKAKKTNVKTHVLLNYVDSKSKKKINELTKYIENNTNYFNLLDSVIHTDDDFRNAYGKGLTVKELNKESKAAQEIKSFVKEIDKIIKNI